MKFFILLLIFTSSSFARHHHWGGGSTININSHNKTYYEDVNIYAEQRSEERIEADLLDERVEYYENRFSTDQATALALIDLSAIKKKTILQVYENYYKEMCPSNILSYAEMDYKTIAMLKEIGFKQTGTSWFFDGEKVSVGRPRLGAINKNNIPDDLYFKVSAKTTDSNSILIKIKTNLADNNYLTVFFYDEKDTTQKHTIDSVYVRDGTMEIEIFSPRISKGNYIIDIEDDLGPGIRNAKLPNKVQACGRYTRLNPLFNDRTRVHAKKMKALSLEKDIFVKNIQTTSFRKSEREKPLASFGSFIDSREIEITDSTKILFGLFTKTITKTVKDSKKYKTVKIGDQVWMAENLNYASKGSRCYDDLQSNCDKYGRLYSWEDSKNVCPDGWHLPSIDEFKTLKETVTHLDETRFKTGLNASTLLRSKTEWIHRNGIDDYGFNVLPTGFFDGKPSPEYQEYKRMGEMAIFWSSTPINDWQTRAFVFSETRRPDYNADNLINASSNADFNSIRCIKDF